MGGGDRQPLYSADRVPMRDLVYRGEEINRIHPVYNMGLESTPEPHYSDDYTKRVIEEQKRRTERMMNALARLGVVDELLPKGMQPIVPYRLPEQEFSF